MGARSWPTGSGAPTRFFLVVLIAAVCSLSVVVNCQEDGKVPVKDTGIAKKRVATMPDDKKNSSPKANPSTKESDLALNSNPVVVAASSVAPPDTYHNESIPSVKNDTTTQKSDEKPDIAHAQQTPFITDDVTMPSSEYLANSGYTNQTDETHDYYNSSVIMDPQQADALWIDLDSMNETITHEMLSESYRRAATVNLTFNFPFYGHPINNVTIATGGFLYVGYKLHMWLAATQYIAPLMANFKASLNSSQSSLKYYDNGTIFVVEWRNVQLEDNREAGNFTFQTILHKNGDIVFVYKQIPISITEIAEKFHPVKVGISDAYLFKRVVFLLKRKTIYEYHSINKKSEIIKSHTAIVMRALPTCVSLKSCEECTTAEINFNCTWCETVQRCSSGVDRHRQSWINSKCDENITPKGQCPVAHVNAASTSAAPDSSGGSAGLQALLGVITIVLGVALWVFYAYRNPRSPSGQFLIKYRPSQWKRHGEARYIAAGSLHM